MIKSTLLLSSVAFSLLSISGCSHDARPAENAPGASAPARELSSAVDDISDERCDLEQRCNNVGAGQSYDNREACETKMHGSIANDLNTKDCPHGLAQAKLSACLSAIKSEECGNPIDSLSRWSACREGELCVD